MAKTVPERPPYFDYSANDGTLMADRLTVQLNFVLAASIKRHWPVISAFLLRYWPLTGT